jgi:hypothetical protein
MKAEQRRQIKARRQRLRRQHRCITCGRKAANRNYCEIHREWHNRYNRDRYRNDPAARERKHQYQRAWYFANHPRNCRWCERPLNPEDRSGRVIFYHEACRELARLARSRQQYHQAKETAWYREAHLQAVRRYQARMRQAGRCRSCGQVNPSGTAICRDCSRRREAASETAGTREHAIQAGSTSRPARPPRNDKRT